MGFLRIFILFTDGEFGLTESRYAEINDLPKSCMLNVRGLSSQDTKWKERVAFLALPHNA